MDGKMLATGRVQKPHGVSGYLKVESFSGETKHLRKLRSLVLEHNGVSTRFTVEDTIKNGDKVLVKLQGIDNPEQGRKFSNSTIWVDRKRAAFRGRKEHYAADLCGCTVVHDGVHAGVVKAICDTDTGAFLEIKANSGESFLLPFTKRYFGKVNTKKRRVEIRENWLVE